MDNLNTDNLTTHRRMIGEPRPIQAFETPTWGASITTGELIALMLLKEDNRSEALETLAQTLADMGISGEEIAHYQKCPGAKHDGDGRYENWAAKAQTFPTSPIAMYK